MDNPQLTLRVNPKLQMLNFQCKHGQITARKGEVGNSSLSLVEWNMDRRKYDKRLRRPQKSHGELVNALLLLAAMAALWAVFSSEPNAIQAAILDLEIFAETDDVLEKLREILGWKMPK